MSMNQVITTEPGRAGHILYESPQGVRVRTMRADDCEFAGRMLVEAFRGKFCHNVGEANLSLTKQLVAEDYMLSPFTFHRLLVAEIDQQRVGLISLKFHGDRNPTSTDNWQRLNCCSLMRMSFFGCMTNESVARGHCYVEMLAVDEHCRGKGVGRTLLNVADQQARAANCNTIYLSVATDNRAKNLYSREGYRVTGTTKCCTYCATGISGFNKMEKRL